MYSWCTSCNDLPSSNAIIIRANNGARETTSILSHGVLSRDAVDRIKASPLEKLVITDSIPLGEEKKCDKIDVVSLAPLLSRIIVALDEGKSLHDVHQQYIEENC